MRRIRKSMIWMGALLFCSGAVFAQKAERKNVRAGNKLYTEEKFTESEIAYRKSLEVNPRSVEGTYNLGNSLYKQKKFPEAAEQYQLLTGQAERWLKPKREKPVLPACSITWEISVCRARNIRRVWKHSNNPCV